MRKPCVVVGVLTLINQLSNFTSRLFVCILSVPQQECMYLHDYGDEAASFSKEEIQQGFVFIDKKMT